MIPLLTSPNSCLPTDVHDLLKQADAIWEAFAVNKLGATSGNLSLFSDAP